MHRAGRALQDLEQSEIFLFLQQCQSVRSEIWSNDHFAKDLGDGFSTGEIQWLIHRDDATKWGLFVRRISLVPSFLQIGPLPYTAWIGMLQNGERGFFLFSIKLTDELGRCREIQDVIVRKLLSVKLLIMRC